MRWLEALVTTGAVHDAMLSITADLSPAEQFRINKLNYFFLKTNENLNVTDSDWTLLLPFIEP